MGLKIKTIFVLCFIFFSCEKKDLKWNLDKVFPDMTTSNVSDVTSSSSTAGGYITSDGGSSITQRGVCWSTNPGATLLDSYTNDGIGIGPFSSSLSGLTSNTTYYYRAYATNSSGTAYGNKLSFQTQYQNVTCNITSVTSSPYTMSLSQSPNSSLPNNVYNFGDQVTVTMYHPSYQFNQGGAALYKNETFITSLTGSFASWSGGQNTITLPSSASGPSNCYTIRVTGAAGNPPYVNISSPITIY